MVLDLHRKSLWSMTCTLCKSQFSLYSVSFLQDHPLERTSMKINTWRLANQDGTRPAIWGRKCLCVCRYLGFLKWKKGLEKCGIRKRGNLVNTLMELFTLEMRSVWGVNWGILFRCGLQALTVTLLTGLVWVMISNVWLLLPLHSHCPIKGYNKCLLTKSTRNSDTYKY